MGADAGRDRRSMRLAGVVLASLFVLVVAANVLWPPPARDPPQPRMPPTATPFPTFAMGPRLHVVSVPSDANLSTHLLLTSLQGLVNRERVELYLDVGGVSGNTTAMRAFLGARYGVGQDPMTVVEALDAYAGRAAGLVVYDPAKPESVNIGTMLAAQWNATLVGPDLAGWMRGRYGLRVLLDYADPARRDWNSLDAIGAYDRALRELRPGSAPGLLAILPPDRWAIRDYLIATKAFVFYHAQGALASPFEAAATLRVLHATPRGIPILGWFDTPTLTEENLFVQMASAEGKFVVGVQDLPNLSVLTAFGRNETHRQAASSGAVPTLGDKTYAVLAVPDGDNLDFVAGRMRGLWAQPERGTMPLAWSLNPLLVDLAPPLLDVYYDTATPQDTFLAAPSGAGYLYPDYTAAGDLASYLAFSKRYLDAADMDVVWLLNAFTASEVTYTPATLSAYVDGLRPDGIVLDYGDQPKTRDAWVAAGSQAVAPVVRSTHFWTTAENFLGKLDAARATWDGGSHFLWITVYTFRFDLRDARTIGDALSARLRGDLEIVTPMAFFRLLREDFVRRAQARYDAMAADPLASTLFAASLASARTWLAQARASLAAGDANSAAYKAFLALEELRGAAAAEALVVSLLVLIAAGLVAFFAQRSMRGRSEDREEISLGMLVLGTAAVAFFVFALREALEQNFWTYPSILFGIALAGTYRPLRTFLDQAYPARAPVAAALVSLVFTALAIRTTAAFPLAMIGTLLAFDAYLARRRASPAALLASLTFGTAVGFLANFDLPTFTVLAVLLVVPTLVLRDPKRLEAIAFRRPRGLFTGFVLALPLAAIAIMFSYALSLRLDLQGDSLSLLAGAVLVVVPTLAIFADRAASRVPASARILGGLGLAVAFAGLVLASRGTIASALALVALFASLSFAALANLREFGERRGDPMRAFASAIGFLPLFVLFFRMPPIVYSLTLVRLPESIEYALYTPPVLIAATTLAAAGICLAWHRRAATAKDYPGEGHRGAGGT